MNEVVPRANTSVGGRPRAIVRTRQRLLAMIRQGFHNTALALPPSQPQTSVTTSSSVQRCNAIPDNRAAFQRTSQAQRKTGRVSLLIREAAQDVGISVSSLPAQNVTIAE